MATDANVWDYMRKCAHTGRKSDYLEDQEADRTEIDNRITYYVKEL
jgi:hypothetical protein